MHRIEQLEKLGKTLESFLLQKESDKVDLVLKAQIVKSFHVNHWFTEDCVEFRLGSVAKFLSSGNFREFFSKIKLSKDTRIIGVVSEERMPLEEFFTLLVILFSGNSFIYKETDKTDPLLIHLFDWIANEIPEFNAKINFTKASLAKTEGLIITGRHQNSELKQFYLERKNVLFLTRNQSIAILEGLENDEELKQMASDIFCFNGQACFSVCKLFIPEGFDVRRIYEPMESFHTVMNSNTYANNYQYQQSVYLMNRIEHFDNGFLLVKEDPAQRAPTGVLYYSFYRTSEELHQQISSTDFYRIYTAKPKAYNELVFGASENQLLLPPSLLIDFLR